MRGCVLRFDVRNRRFVSWCCSGSSVYPHVWCPLCTRCLFCIVCGWRAVLCMVALTDSHVDALTFAVKLLAVTIGRFARYATPRAQRMQRVMMSCTFEKVLVRSVWVHTLVLWQNLRSSVEMAGDVVFAESLLGFCSLALDPYHKHAWSSWTAMLFSRSRCCVACSV